MENNFYNSVKERLEITEDRKKSRIFIVVLSVVLVLVSTSSIIMAIKIRKLEEAVLELENKRKEMAEVITLLEETDSAILTLIRNDSVSVVPGTSSSRTSDSYSDPSLTPTPETTKPTPTPNDDLNSTPETDPPQTSDSSDSSLDSTSTPGTTKPAPTPNDHLSSTSETISTPPIC